jgi:hypothetical protein
VVVLQHAMHGFRVLVLTKHDRGKQSRFPACHVFGTGAVCYRAWLQENCKEGEYLLADGVRVSDHTEVSLRSCHGHCVCASVLLLKCIMA